MSNLQTSISAQARDQEMQSQEPPAPDTYGIGDASFRAAGGEPGIQKLVEDFYEIMGGSARSARLFSMHPDNIEISIDKLARFLCGWLGGPARYSEKYGPIRLPMAHAHLPVTGEDRDAWLWCMEQALRRQPYPEKFQRYLLQALSIPSERIVEVCRHMRGASA
ncbi:MAG: group II truncated hemoglobin [Burkholderiaceae bacterium]